MQSVIGLGQSISRELQIAATYVTYRMFRMKVENPFVTWKFCDFPVVLNYEEQQYNWKP